MDFVSTLAGYLSGNTLLSTVAVALVRSAAGFFENVAGNLKDGKVKPFELAQLLETFLRTLPQVLGLAAFGLPPEAALATDMIATKIAKK